MLTEQHHGRILQNLENICSVANIPKSMLSRSAKDFCSPLELEWLKKFPVMQRSNRGLLLVGKHSPGPDLKMMALAAAFIRNYIDARVVTTQTLVQANKDGEIPDPTVLLVPNLYVKQSGKGVHSWMMQVLYDILLSRFTSGKITVAYIESIPSFLTEYGQLLTSHFQDNYLISEG